MKHGIYIGGLCLLLACNAISRNVFITEGFFANLIKSNISSVLSDTEIRISFCYSILT